MAVSTSRALGRDDPQAWGCAAAGSYGVHWSVPAPTRRVLARARHASGGWNWAGPRCHAPRRRFALPPASPWNRSWAPGAARLPVADAHWHRHRDRDGHDACGGRWLRPPGGWSVRRWRLAAADAPQRLVRSEEGPVLRLLKDGSEYAQDARCAQGVPGPAGEAVAARRDVADAGHADRDSRPHDDRGDAVNVAASRVPDAGAGRAPPAPPVL